jgi:hypothetical protein
MWRAKRPGANIRHWLLVGALLGAIAAGLRIACEAPDDGWTAALNSMLAQSGMWIIPIVVAIIYPIVLAHFAFGGVAQLLRLFRPVQLAPSQPHFDPHPDLDEP